jgi:tetratricopeptide (TPR) repeat protein
MECWASKTQPNLQRSAQPTRLRKIVFVLLCLISAPTLAQSIDYDPRRDTELRPCDDHQYRGRVSEAKECYSRLLNESGNALVEAESAWALGDIEHANQLFRQAVSANRRSVQPRVRWGQLFLQTHQYADATTLFRDALEIFPNDAYAKLGMAQVYAERFEGEARTLIESLLQQDDQVFDAHLLAARMALEEGRFEAVDASLDRAAKIADSRKLPQLEVFSLRAVLDAARGRMPDGKDGKRNQWVNRALAYNPRYGAVYEELAHFEVMRRRYREATELLRRAVEVQPDLWSAQAELGASLLRLGMLDEARTHLAAAYSGDPYSPTTVNTLRLLDRVDEFDFSSTSLSVPAIQGGGDKQVEVRLRLHRKEAEALRPYVLELARDGITTFSQRYGFEPREPMTIELYPDHDDFAVRVAALPGIGLLGVTFGYLVAMDSPSGRATGEFHWGSTLWHEMAHVFTLEITEHRVPRWLSEGISVFEEWRTGPTPGVVVTPEAITALKDKRLLPVAELDAGFIRPQYPSQVQVSYMQSGLVCLFIEQRWGFDKLSALLRQFTRETTTQAAVEATFKMPSAEFDKQFDAFARERYKTLLLRLDEFQQAHLALRKAISTEQWANAVDPARKAIEIYPEHSGPGSPYLLLAQALEKSGQREQAITALQQYRQAGGWDPAALRELAAWLEAAGRTSEAIQMLVALNYVDPLDASQHAQLGERLLSAGKSADALREFRVLLALSAHDAAPANFGMARASKAMGDTAASRRHVLDALAIAPHYKLAQELLLQLIKERKNNE